MDLLLIPIVLISGGVLAWLSSFINDRWPGIISVVFLLAGLLLTLFIFMQGTGTSPVNNWLREVNLPWITRFGISIHLAVDYLSLFLLILTHVLGIVSVLASWKEIKMRSGFFHFNLMWVIAGIAGVFMSLDLFLFYFFWELMLIPMYFLISIWGHEKRKYASFKFFIFTQAGGLFMFISIVTLWMIHGNSTGIYTFDYNALLSVAGNLPHPGWIMAGFMAAFLVKLPALPVHTWLPDAHTQAPTAGSVILAGLLLKTGAYGLFRFIIPFFPKEVAISSPWFMILGAAGILYGAKLAFAQHDIKRLVAYTSISHMGFVLLGVFSFNPMAMKGAVMQMLAHGISTGALFVIAGIIGEKAGTRDIRQMGGLWARMPGLGGITMVFVLASLGLPGMGNFVAEFLILAGSFQTGPVITVIAATALIASSIYALVFMQRLFFGANQTPGGIAGINFREAVNLSVMVILILWLGIFPGPVLKKLDMDQERVHAMETVHQNIYLKEETTGLGLVKKQ